MVACINRNTTSKGFVVVPSIRQFFFLSLAVDNGENESVCDVVHCENSTKDEAKKLSLHARDVNRKQAKSTCLNFIYLRIH